MQIEVMVVKEIAFTKKFEVPDDFDDFASLWDQTMDCDEGDFYGSRVQVIDLSTKDVIFDDAS